MISQTQPKVNKRRGNSLRKYAVNLRKFEDILKIMSRHTPGSFYCHEHEVVCNNGVHPKGSYNCQHPYINRHASTPAKPRLVSFKSAPAVSTVTFQNAGSEPLTRSLSVPTTTIEHKEYDATFLLPSRPRNRKSRLPPSLSLRHRLHKSHMDTLQVSSIPSPGFSPYYKIKYTASSPTGSDSEDNESDYEMDHVADQSDTSSIMSGVSPRSTNIAADDPLMYQSDYTSKEPLISLVDLENEEANGFLQPSALPSTDESRRTPLRDRMTTLIRHFHIRRSGKKLDKEAKRKSKVFRRLSLPEKRRLHIEDEASVFLESRSQLNAQYVA